MPRPLSGVSPGLVSTPGSFIGEPGFPNPTIRGVRDSYGQIIS